MSKRYILDANPFIEAKNRYYGMDICPGFWDSLVEHYESKNIVSIDRIRDELISQNDEIKNWILNTPEAFFKKTEDQAVIEEFNKMVNWVFAEEQFTDAAKNEFASVADGWVLAYASVNKLVVVTHEEYAPEVKRKVPMPNVCIEFNVEYVNTFDMLRDLGEQFIRRRRKKSK
ncbi:MAG: DUF4411 family protein [Pirellulales bacterium]